MEPVTTDMYMVAVTADTCDGTATDATCAHTCADGYEGGSITCQDDGSGAAEFDVVACTEEPEESEDLEDGSSKLIQFPATLLFAAFLF